MTVSETTPRDDAEPSRLVVISAGVSDPSSTRLLADRITQKSLDPPPSGNTRTYSSSTAGICNLEFSVTAS
jgi:hypothetical protein